MGAATLLHRYVPMADVQPLPGLERFSRWLRTHMEARSLSQRQVAAFTDVAPTTVGLWMKGFSKPRPESLKKLADGLGNGVTYKFLISLIDANLEGGGGDSGPHYDTRYKELDTEIAAKYTELAALIHRRRQADNP